MAFSNSVDERAEHWRQEQEIQATARALEQQAKRDQMARARRKNVNLRLRGDLPTWQRWIVYPIGALILWECLRVVFFGGKMR